MLEKTTKNPVERTQSSPEQPKSRKGISVFAYKANLDDSHPSLIHFTSTPLFRLEKDHQKYVHLLKKKDTEHLGPLVNYFIRNSGHVAYLGGDAIKNLFLQGRKKYKSLNVLIILTSQEEVEKYSSLMNNIISSNDGAFSMKLKYRIRKNRCDGCFREIAQARYVIEPRLEGFEKLLYPLRASAIELDITTQARFSEAYRLEDTV